MRHNGFTSEQAPSWGKQMGGYRELDPIDARDGFSPTNPETFGPRALDDNKEALRQARERAVAERRAEALRKAQADAAAARAAARDALARGDTPRTPDGVAAGDSQAADDTTTEKVKKYLPLIVVAAVIAYAVLS